MVCSYLFNLIIWPIQVLFYNYYFIIINYFINIKHTHLQGLLVSSFVDGNHSSGAVLADGHLFGKHLKDGCGHLLLPNCGGAAAEIKA